MVVTVTLVLAAMMVAMTIPAFADKGRSPPTHTFSRGLGKESVHVAIAFPESPGASEAGRNSTESCRGKD